nr:uncharacterized protein LOC113800044 [Penaeus vannamei]
MNVHVFGARSSPSCVNYALRKTAEDHGGWRLNQWTANNKDVLKKIPESERDASVASLDLSKDDLPVERTLGVHWSMAEDCFTFKICLGDKPLTREEFYLS